MAGIVRRNAAAGCGARNLGSRVGCRSWAARMAFEPACGRLPRRAGEETASKGAETLEALNREIDGLIDNAAAVEMWDRWRRGDTGAVSRRLYTEAGQQAFDELRRRFRADPQFRETTTRYMQEFERLLSKIGQNDRDGSQWRAYLLSNTGKVYTILAHASGKLG